MDPRQCPFSVTLVLLVTTLCIHGQMRSIKIGAIFHKGEEDLRSVFLRAISDTKNGTHALTFELVPVTRYIQGNTDSFMTGKAACELLEEGVAAIFGPSSRYTSGIVASIAARFNIPHIEYVWRESEGKKKQKKTSQSMTINIFPASEQVSQAIADVVDSMKWRKFVAIYETNEGLSRLQKTLTLKGDKDAPIRHTVQKLNEGPDYRSMLKKIRHLSVWNIIIDVKPENIMEVLYQAKEVNLLADYCNFVITYLDSSMLPIAGMRNNTVNITGLSIRENDVEKIDWLDSAVLYDAVFLLYEALETLNARNIENKVYMSIDPVRLSCIDKTTMYEAGPNIVSVMQKISKKGKITGIMNIDEYGRRQHFNVKILNFQQSGVIQTGYWDFNGIHTTQIKEEKDIYLERFMEEKIFKISVYVYPPYVMESYEFHFKIILRIYQGFCIDLIKHIAKILKFKGVVFQRVTDGYGSYNPQTKTWNGLIRSILDHEADLAISDLTITSSRQSVVDFSLPFMSSGHSILFRKPEKKAPPFFPFLLPLSTEVWLYMAIAYLIVSIMLFVQARMAPNEWNNPHHLSNADPEELKNNFNFKNSFFLTIGSFMQQDSNILPKASSLRMLASMWCFFILIIYSLYTANLAAFLTMNKMDIPIKGIEDLPKQTKIKYGAIKGSYTATFFKNSNYSTYRKIWAAMINSKPSVFTSNYKEGIDRVLNSNRQYAFLMESAAIEYNIERKCDLIKIGDDVVGNSGYGIAMPRNSPYRTHINRAILMLKEQGILEELKTKWWKNKEGDLCEKDEMEKDSRIYELGMASLGGLFFILICGCSASFFIAICEFLWNIRKIVVTEKITPREALVAELKFAVNIFAIRKPVKIAKSSNNNISSRKDGLDRAVHGLIYHR
ncbi:PREDICTED: glutamate receptor ionotropic, kainate 2-like [Trachymyrmex septentrionalis]|uniref:glutamate receptor ionotropic, kainate 2-like n=1 Tax=Trachymyrmex septentrionalis TaxID=34720 RepID=UPI00084F009D|nr:PREDICTED: glutamate receptor ionotropic, kainate 2-like [Trachymyrmex septentrionalis]